MYIYTRIVREVRGQSNLRQNYCVQDEVCFMNCQMKKKSLQKITRIFSHFIFFFTLHDLDLELVCELTTLMCIYIYISTEGCVYYIFQCMLEFICQICIEPRIGNCYWTLLDWYNSDFCGIIQKENLEKNQRRQWEPNLRPLGP